MIVDYIGDRRYCSVHSLLTTGDLFGADFVYNEIPNKLNLYDYKLSRLIGGNFTRL